MKGLGVHRTLAKRLNTHILICPPGLPRLLRLETGCSWRRRVGVRHWWRIASLRRITILRVALLHARRRCGPRRALILAIGCGGRWRVVWTLLLSILNETSWRGALWRVWLLCVRILSVGGLLCLLSTYQIFSTDTNFRLLVNSRLRSRFSSFLFCFLFSCSEAA